MLALLTETRLNLYNSRHFSKNAIFLFFKGANKRNPHRCCDKWMDITARQIEIWEENTFAFAVYFNMLKYERGAEMVLEIKYDGIWYHGSNVKFNILREGSTITQWKALAEAFSHKPTLLCYDDNGTVFHNGIEKGYLYVISEPIKIGVDIYQHPRTTMDANAEFLTSKPLKVKMIAEL